MDTLRTDDGITLGMAEWAQPPVGAQQKGTVLLVHGLGEHIGRYAHVMAHLQQAGWAVAGYDQRGHGRSEGPRGGTARGDSLLTDLGAVIGQLRTRHPGPLVLLGHSMGGTVAGRYVAEALAAQPAPWWQPVDALVMSSPALDPGMSRLQNLLLVLMERLAPTVAVNNGLKPGWISRDAAVVQAYRADPLVHDRITARTARFIVDAGLAVREAAPRWSLPTLLLYAGADRCVAPRGSDAFAAAAPRATLASRRFDGLSHEIFNEPEQAQVLQALCDWLAMLPMHRAARPAAA